MYKNGNLNYSDTPVTAFTKADILGKQHHIVLECETPYVRTYIDDILVDTYTDTQGVLAVGDLGVRVSATGNEREKAYFDNITQIVYDAEGTPTTTFTEDFEGAGNAFNATDIRDYDGSRQCYMEAAVGGSKRLMQQDGSIAPGMPMFRKAFDLSQAVRRARFYATGLGVYDVYINGQRVGQTDEEGHTLYDELKPGSTEMKKTVFYTTHDVTALLHEGRNAIGAVMSTGWWNGAIVHGMYGNKPNAFRALLEVELEDGSKQVVPTDLTWLSNTNGPLRKGDVYNGETYDARLEDGQFTPDYDDTGWFGTAVSNDFKGEIRAFEGPAIMAVEGLRRYPQTIQIYEGTKPNGKTFGAINVVEEITGQNNFNLSAGQTAVIDLGQNGSEAEVQDGLGALPYGDYRLQELRCDTNEGYKLLDILFYVETDQTIEPIIDRHRPSWRELLLSLITVCGILLIFGFDTRYRLGIAVGCLSSLLYALFSVLSKCVQASTGRASSTMLLWVV